MANKFYGSLPDAKKKHVVKPLFYISNGKDKASALITEYSGETLDTFWIDKLEGLDQKHVYSIMQQLIDCVGWLRDAKIKHHDLKPENILISHQVEKDSYVVK